MIEGRLTGAPTSKSGPHFNYLFFANDNLLFCRATQSQWRAMTNILKMNEKASGQKMNACKTSIFISKNTSMEDREQILELAGILATQRYDTYLRLLALVGKSRTTVF
jgi:hypothetical protein